MTVVPASWIYIPKPAMVWNASGLNGRGTYKMDNTITVEASADINWLCSWSAVVFGEFKKEYPKAMKRLIINSHNKRFKDEKGEIKIGGIDIGAGITGPEDANAFAKLAPFVDEIIVVACGVAQVSIPGGIKKTVPGFRKGAGDGIQLLGAIAKAAVCKVYAPDVTQKCPESSDEIPVHYIDPMEGTILIFGPDGNVIAKQKGSSLQFKGGGLFGL